MTGFLSTLRDMSQAQFQTAYLKTTEQDWRTMPRENLLAWQSEVVRRGLGRSLEDKVGEVTLPTERWLKQQSTSSEPASQETKAGESSDTPTPSPSTTSTSESETVRLASGQEMTREEAKAAWENAKRQLLPVARLLGIVSPAMTQKDFVLIPGTASSLPEASTGSGETSTGTETVPVAGREGMIDPRSSETSSGAPTSAASGYGMVAYQRLPLAAKRDAFIADGFLYVRNDTLKEWFRHLRAGRCCPNAQEGVGFHSSDCWIHRDAVR